MFIGDLGLFKFGLELGLIDRLENILEAAVVGFKNRVLGRQVNRELAVEAIVQRGAGKFLDRVIKILHGHGNA